MLLPRFSLRASLIAVSTCAVFFLVLGQAVRSEVWAIVVSVAVVSMCVLLAFHATVYLMCVGIGRVITPQQTPARTSRGGVQSTPDVHTAPPTSSQTPTNSELPPSGET